MSWGTHAITANGFLLFSTSLHPFNELHAPVEECQVGQQWFGFGCVLSVLRSHMLTSSLFAGKSSPHLRLCKTLLPQFFVH
jgi:hypothetical protein